MGRAAVGDAPTHNALPSPPHWLDCAHRCSSHWCRKTHSCMKRARNRCKPLLVRLRQVLVKALDANPQPRGSVDKRDVTTGTTMLRCGDHTHNLSLSHTRTHTCTVHTPLCSVLTQSVTMCVHVSTLPPPHDTRCSMCGNATDASVRLPALARQVTTKQANAIGRTTLEASSMPVCIGKYIAA